ncbi:MAG TPA: hypothetical protein VM287_01035 [Egibacteraceae bacterium]|nr:hypothetical protein [Egibacteraceae bacterium]
MPAEDPNDMQRYDSTPSEEGKKPQDRGLLGANTAIEKDRDDESGESSDERPKTVEEAKQDG